MKRSNAFGIGVVLLLVVSLLPLACLAHQQVNIQECIVTYLGTREGVMPPMMDIDDVVAAVLESHAQDGGSTIHFRWGNLSGIPLYVVSLFPDLGIIREGKEISAEEIRGLIEANYDLLKDPRVCIGTWFNPADGYTYIDINVVMADREKAIALGKKFNQIAIFNLATFELIPTGGDGRPIENLPLPEDRLPEF